MEVWNLIHGQLNHLLLLTLHKDTMECQGQGDLCTLQKQYQVWSVRTFLGEVRSILEI